MRATLFSFLLLALAACASDPGETPVADNVPIADPAPGEPVAVGEALAADAEFLTASAVAEQAESLSGGELAVEGTVREVCQNAGCWLTLDNEAGVPFRVVVPKDEAGVYVYTFPTDISGSRAQLVGDFSVEEESVETLRHLAEDAGESPESIAAITEPKRTLVLTARGARLAAPADA